MTSRSGAVLTAKTEPSPPPAQVVRACDPSRGRVLLRALDKLVGIPLVVLGSLFKRRREKPADIRTIHLLKTACIGDTVLLLGVLAPLRAAYPQARVRLYLGSSNAAMKAFLPDDVEVYILPVNRPLASLRMLRRDPGDVMLDFGPWPRLDALLAGWSGARWVIGLRRDGQFRHGLYDEAVAFDEQRHVYDNYAAIVAQLGVTVDRVPSIEAGNARQNRADDVPSVVVHMFPGGRNAELRTWSADKWIQLISRLTAAGFRVLLTGAPADRDAAAAIRRGSQQPERVELVAGCSLLETVQALAASDCVVTVDTGVMHLAAAAGCRIVSLHGPMSPRRFGPLTDTAISLEPGSECQSCARLGGEMCRLNRICIDDITVDRVLAAVDTATFRGQPSSTSPSVSSPQEVST